MRSWRPLIPLLTVAALLAAPAAHSTGADTPWPTPISPSWRQSVPANAELVLWRGFNARFSEDDLRQHLRTRVANPDGGLTDAGSSDADAGVPDVETFGDMLFAHARGWSPDQSVAVTWEEGGAGETFLELSTTAEDHQPPAFSGSPHVRVDASDTVPPNSQCGVPITGRVRRFTFEDVGAGEPVVYAISEAGQPVTVLADSPPTGMLRCDGSPTGAGLELFRDGSHTLEVQARDRAGNVSATVPVAFEISCGPVPEVVPCRADAGVGEPAGPFGCSSTPSSSNAGAIPAALLLLAAISRRRGRRCAV